MSPASLCALAVAAALLANHLTAQGAPPAQWTPTAALGNPGARPGQNPGYTLTPLADGTLLLFGGDLANASATEWRWDGIAWTPYTTPVPRRSHHAIAALPNGDVLLFGGVDAQNQPLADTWLLSQGTWTQLSTSNSPPPFAVQQASVDPRDGAVILVGGNGTTRETWRFANGDWAPVATTTPGGTGFALGTDAVRGTPILTTHTIGSVGGQLYTFDDGQWVLRQSFGQQPILTQTAGFDPERGRYVLALVQPSGTQSYEWDGLHLTAAPFSLNVFANGPAAWHATRRELVVAAPTPAGVQIVRWTAGPRPFATPYGPPCQDPAFVLVLAAGSSPAPGTSHLLTAPALQPNAFAFALLGFSHVVDGGAPLPRPLPFGGLGCLQRAQALAGVLLPNGPTLDLAVPVPNSLAMLGLRYDAQFLLADTSGLLDATNGLEIQVGAEPGDQQLLEAFASNANRDPEASGDLWSNGGTSAVAIGGDGRHGSFDATLGVPTGPNVYVWDTTSVTIPGSRTLDGQAALITDGQFAFTDFVVPAGVTVEFRGPVAPVIRVRGRVAIEGSVTCNGEDLPYWIPTSGPALGQRVSSFNARSIPNTPAPYTDGQPGTSGGPGGGRGGDGGAECRGTGPIVVGGVTLTDGQPGQDVRVATGHAYLASTGGTGGRGSAMMPPSGAAAPNTPLLGSVYRAHFAPGGGGGGFALPGGSSSVTPLGATVIGSPASGGGGFSLMPYPPTTLPRPDYSSLDHFVVGGSGGGGGATHAFGTIYVVGDVYVAGSGGSGGGGALALRAGGPLTVGNAATLQAKGGNGVLINGDNATTGTSDTLWGISSPGGGGSGGSLLLQSAADLTVAGALDTSGGPGSRTGSVSFAVLNLQSQAGAGSAGFVRLEAAGTTTVTGSTVPALVAGTHTGPLTDRDAHSGSRSTWLLVASDVVPTYRRYELLVDVNGVPTLYSDDSTVSTLRADDPNGAVVFRVQGARLDALTNQIDPTTIGPWRSSLLPGDPASVNRDLATHLRFDLVANKAVGTVVVREVRIVWR